ncbi:hypothetical protein [Micromonospora sp. NPDC004551]|uniref:hypothetical protein n=1 Tax=Micromonospora sp. NPDC004551 TaxID=3154284 RepID=UPI0033BCD62E
MPTQETLPGTAQPARDRGLWARFVDADGLIIHSLWMRACAEQTYVGTCRRCGDHLRPERPMQVTATRQDYEARCVRPIGTCGWTCNAPGGRVFRGSSRDRERTKGDR